MASWAWWPASRGRGGTTTGADPGPAPTTSSRDFTADAPGCRLVGDITYIPTWEGWLYLATVIDLRTKEVVGWSMEEDMNTP